jgi:hypothetical protein
MAIAPSDTDAQSPHPVQSCPRRTRSTVGDAGKAILISLNRADGARPRYNKKGFAAV